MCEREQVRGEENVCALERMREFEWKEIRVYLRIVKNPPYQNFFILTHESIRQAGAFYLVKKLTFL